MGVNINSSGIKYVFTQATAPSGEGEVEGSLWYDTSTNDLYTYNGSSWVAVSVPSNLVLVENKVLTGTATEFSFTGLSGDKQYMMMGTLKNATAGGVTISFQANTDSTVTNYYDQKLQADNGTITAARANHNEITNIPANGNTWFQLWVKKDVDGYLRVSNHSLYGAVSGIQVFIKNVTWNSTAAITSLQIVSAANMDIGSNVALYEVTTS